MQLIGYMGSPFVRRVAVTARLLGIPYEHRELSIFSDVEEFRRISPLTKVPTVIADDGTVLVESTLIIDYLELLAGKRLRPDTIASQTAALQVIGTALVAMEKVAQLTYEKKHRPIAVQHPAWIQRLQQQLRAAADLMEAAVGDGSQWVVDGALGHADIAVAIAWRVTQYMTPETVAGERYPGLTAFSARAEKLPEFAVCPLK